MEERRCRSHWPGQMQSSDRWNTQTPRRSSKLCSAWDRFQASIDGLEQDPRQERQNHTSPNRAGRGGGNFGLAHCALSVAPHHNRQSGIGTRCELIKALTAVKNPKVSAVDCDLVMEGRRLVAALPIEVTWKCIKGHQDKIAGQHLDWWALQNIRMDRKAKRHRKKNKGNAMGPLCLSTERWAFTVAWAAEPRRQDSYDPHSLREAVGWNTPLLKTSSQCERFCEQMMTNDAGWLAFVHGFSNLECAKLRTVHGFVILECADL